MVFLRLWCFVCLGFFVWLVGFALVCFFSLPREFALLFKLPPRRSQRQQSPAEHLRGRAVAVMRQGAEPGQARPGPALGRFSLQQHLRWEKRSLKTIP